MTFLQMLTNCHKNKGKSLSSQPLLNTWSLDLDAHLSFFLLPFWGITFLTPSSQNIWSYDHRIAKVPQVTAASEWSELTACWPQGYSQQCSSAFTISPNRQPLETLMKIQSPSVPKPNFFFFPSCFQQTASRMLCNAKRSEVNWTFW